jgi:hypothetical protein
MNAAPLLSIGMTHPSIPAGTIVPGRGGGLSELAQIHQRAAVPLGRPPGSACSVSSAPTTSVTKAAWTP